MSVDAAHLLDDARRVLAGNWTGASTVPSRTQYPHQWSWDAAFIAIGWSRLDPARGAAELRALLRGQWADGRVPHIVFNPDVPEDAYFPGPAFWRARAPGGAATSGLVQPPLHARAALAVARAMGDAGQGRDFLRAVFPALEAQHRYLTERRDAGGAGLAAIVHPWESGLDDSPAWDEPLAAVELPAGGVAPYERRDRRHVDPAERPSDAAYDRFVHLARGYRDGGYADEHLAERGGFVVEDPLFNAILLWSAHALLEIAGLVGADAGRLRESAATVHEALVARLWDAERRRFRPRDVLAGRPLTADAVVSLAPLLDPELPRETAEAVASDLRSAHWRGDGGLAVPSADRLSSAFDRRRYWRGPIWANVNWLLARGLEQHGFGEQAAELDATTLALAAGAGMREYFDPETGEGRGSREFSWTAALAADAALRGGGR